MLRYDVVKKKIKQEKIASFLEFDRLIDSGRYTLLRCDPVVDHQSGTLAALLHEAFVSCVTWCVRFLLCVTRASCWCVAMRLVLAYWCVAMRLVLACWCVAMRLVLAYWCVAMRLVLAYWCVAMRLVLAYWCVAMRLVLACWRVAMRLMLACGNAPHVGVLYVSRVSCVVGVL